MEVVENNEVWKFIDEYDDIKQNPSMYEGPMLSDIESTTSATVKQQIVPVSLLITVANAWL